MLNTHQLFLLFQAASDFKRNRPIRISEIIIEAGNRYGIITTSANRVQIVTDYNYSTNCKREYFEVDLAELIKDPLTYLQNATEKPVSKARTPASV